MKLKDIMKTHYEPKWKEVPHSKNDISSHVKKVLQGAHFDSLGLKCISSQSQLAKGLLIFKDKKNRYKIDIDGKYYEGTKELGEVKKSSDLHSQYSSAISELTKWIKENETK